MADELNWECGSRVGSWGIGCAKAFWREEGNPAQGHTAGEAASEGGRVPDEPGEGRAYLGEHWEIRVLMRGLEVI